MRIVELGPLEGRAPLLEWQGIVRRTGHLNARMEELLPDGLLVAHGLDTAQGIGWVHIRFPRLESGEAARRLREEYGIRSLPVEGDAVGFLVTGRASFEDMDYVQGAVVELFLDSLKETS